MRREKIIDSTLIDTHNNFLITFCNMILRIKVIEKKILEIDISKDLYSEKDFVIYIHGNTKK